MTIKLEGEQASGLVKIVEWYKGGDSTPQLFYLAGYAGTGKSTLLKVALEYLYGVGLRRHAIGTFTGKAASVLRKKGNPDAATLHSLMYVKNDEGEWILNIDGEFSMVDLIVVDEVSQVDKVMGADILSFGKKVLVMGDPGQLPPVSGAGFLTEREPDHFLHEVHRQAKESPIIMLATMAREGKQLPYGEWDAGEKGRAKVLPLNGDTQKLLYRPETQPICGLHRVRIGYTQRLRRLRGFEGPLPCEGERLLIRKNDRDLGVFNGMFCELNGPIMRYKRRAGDDEEMARFIKMNLDVEDRGLIEKVLTDPGLFDKHFDQTLPEPKWRKGIMQIDWGYFLTAHVAQGSEWESVTVVDDAGAFREDRHRWRYTTLTRGSDEAVYLRRE